MMGTRSDPGCQPSSMAMKSADESLQAQVDQLKAELQAQQLMAEVVLHGICFEIEGSSRLRLLDLMETVHQELASELSPSDTMVQAFAEQKDRLISLLVDCLNQAKTPISDKEGWC